MEMNVNLWSDSAGFPLLTMLTFVPLVTMVAILYVRSPDVALRYGFIGTLLTLLLSAYLLYVFDAHRPGIHLAEQFHFAGFKPGKIQDLVYQFI